jgi:GNAT superfamily N-acetyltransferase
MSIRPAAPADVVSACTMQADSFADDMQMAYFFGPDAKARRPSVQRFFAILMQARLALGMPVHLWEEGGEIKGLVMGYDCSRPDWPRHSVTQWDALVEAHAGLQQRFAHYDVLSRQFEPKLPHYYLGVLGVAPDRKGQGVGRRLIEAFCAFSNADRSSAGVYLDTAQGGNPAFYAKCGFSVVGQEALDETTTLTGLFRPRNS